jgi:hypothetical protein
MKRTGLAFSALHCSTLYCVLRPEVESLKAYLSNKPPKGGPARSRGRVPEDQANYVPFV